MKKPLDIKPLREMVAIQLIEDPTETKSGIILAGQKDKKPSKGLVVATGPGFYAADKFVPITVKEGDLVLFGKYASDHACRLGDDIIIISETEIMCVIK